MRTANQIRAEIAERDAKIQAIVDIAKEENRQPTAEESVVIDSILGAGDKKGEIDVLNGELERAIKYEARVSANLSKVVADKQIETEARTFKIPAQAKRRGCPKHFDTIEDAYASGQFLLAALGNEHQKPKAQQWCREHGLITDAMSGTDNTKGGFTVPDPLESTVLRVVESYGKFRQNSYLWPMSSASTNVPRRSGGFTVAYAGENATMSTGDMAFTQVKLTAKKPYALCQVSRELSEDSIIDLAGLMALEFGLALATAEDQAGFNGDGTGTYGGILGLKSALAAGSKSTATAITTFATLTLAHFHAVKALLPEYQGMNAKWYISSQGFAASMEALQTAAGGNTASDIQNGGMPMFLGSPVVKTQVLPTALTSITGQIAAYYGDLRMATTMGTRRGMSIESDSSIYFLQDALAVKCTERYDIVVNEPGTASVAGPIVALVMG
jgi:HK97 family phage major capsid protein